MQSRLACLVATAAIVALAFASTAAAATVAVASSSALKSATARQATLPGACAAAVGLDAPLPAQESAMLCLINETRERYDLPPLASSPLLETSATAKGNDLISCNAFSHTACGREFSFWIRQTGYMASTCWRVGENLAWGIDEQATVGSIFHAWMHSPTHRENILGNFEETGLDLQVGELGGLAGVHVWIEHFGSHCGA